jgi:hypothetical protein
MLRQVKKKNRIKKKNTHTHTQSQYYTSFQVSNFGLLDAAISTGVPFCSDIIPWYINTMKAKTRAKAPNGDVATTVLLVVVAAAVLLVIGFEAVRGGASGFAVLHLKQCVLDPKHFA